MQTNPAVLQSKIISPWNGVISPVREEKVYGGKDLLKSRVLSAEWEEIDWCW